MISRYLLEWLAPMSSQPGRYRFSDQSAATSATPVTRHSAPGCRLQVGADAYRQSVTGGGDARPTQTAAGNPQGDKSPTARQCCRMSSNCAGVSSGSGRAKVCPRTTSPVLKRRSISSAILNPPKVCGRPLVSTDAGKSIRRPAQ